jgi:hypothetical protein
MIRQLIRGALILAALAAITASVWGQDMASRTLR